MLDLSQQSQYRKSTASKKLEVEPVPAWGKVPPAQYHEVFGKLTPMGTGEDRLSVAFANGAAGHNVPLISRRSVEVYPGIRSFDPAFLDFLRALSETFDAEFPVDLDEHGFTRTGIHAGFDRLKCPAGYYANPMSYTTVDNASYRTEELGLSAGYSIRQRQIAEELWKITFAEVDVTAINVPKLSTGGVRRFTFDVQWKLAYVEWLHSGDRFERMLTAVDTEDWQTLANEYEMLFMTYIQKRGQVDSVGKQRISFDLAYALSSGKKGKAIPADKRVVIDGREYQDFSAIRARVVHAGPWVINCFLQMIGTPVMRSLFRRFPSTFHVNTKEQILAVVNGKHVLCSDVHEYDRSMSRDALEVPHAAMREKFDPRLVKASWRLVTSPYYSKPLDIDGKKGTWVLDPTNWKQEVFAGNRSGHALTSLFAKVNKVAETLMLIDHIYPVLGRVKSFLEGAMPMGMVNNGDDEIVWATESADMDRFRKLRADKSVGHYIVAPEDGQAFSGLLLVKTGDKTYDPTMRLHTPFEKLWIPERSIGGKHRKYWPIGVMARIDNLMNSAQGRHAWELHNRVYDRHMAPVYGGFMETLFAAVAKMDMSLDSLSAIDKEVLDSPDKIHHKYTADEVSPVVLNKITTKIPTEVVESFLKRYYTGVLQ